MDPARDLRAGARPALIERLRRALRPPRRLRPTRAGWVFFGLTLGVGFAALNTGNNLLYLVLSLMLAFLVLSGVLSESALRGVSVRRRLPRELFASTPAWVALEIHNANRRVPAFALVVEDFAAATGRPRPGRALGRVFALRIGPGERETRSYRLEVAQRGALALFGFRLSTRFPFGLFSKSLEIEEHADTVVFPALDGVRAAARRSAGDDPAPATEAGAAAGHEVSGLRDFAPGDPLRRVHWRASLRRGALVVRELAGARGGEAEVQLRTRDVAPGERFEAAVRRAASETVALLGAGVRVALRTDSARLAPEAGVAQRQRLLHFLALVAPDDAAASPGQDAS